MGCDMCGKGGGAVLFSHPSRTGRYCDQCVALIEAMEKQQRLNRESRRTDLAHPGTTPNRPPSLPHVECKNCHKRVMPDQMYNDRFCKQCLIDHALANRRREEAKAAAPAPAGPPYFTVDGCKKYVSKWLDHVAHLNASQPRHYLRQRALPPKESET